MPRHLHITVTDPEGDDLFTAIDAVPHCPVSFSLNTRLSRLSWEIADGHLSYRETLDRFEKIESNRAGGLSLPTELLLVACANASFCRLFGGDITAMAIVAVATIAGYYMKLKLLKHHFDIRVAVMASAFVSAVLAAGDSLFTLGSTPDIAIGTSVLYLVPGVPLLNSFSDMLYRHYICAFSRLVDATVLTACLSIGLCAGMLLMNQGMFLNRLLDTVRSMSLEFLFQDALFAAIAAIGFACISRPPSRAYWCCGVIAAIGHSTRYMLINTPGIEMHIVPATLLAATVIGLLAVFLSPLVKCPAETCLFPALLPMIPGIYAYKSVAGLAMCVLHDNPADFDRYYTLFTHNGLTCICILLVMVTGATIPIFMFKRVSFSATR